MENPNEIWQVDVNGEIYDTSFEELTNWVLESSVLKTDKVRRGNLRWLEAGKVPMLREFFNAKEQGITPPNVSINTPEADSNENADAVQSEQNSFNLSDNQVNETQTFGEEPVFDQKEAEFQDDFNSLENNIDNIDTSVCDMHKDAPSSYLCEACSHAFCKACPNSYGGTVKTCPYCGGMCKPLKEFQDNRQREFQYRSDISGGFGFDDFGKALAYPFKFKSSLFFGGLLFAILSYGQSAASIGSIFLIGAALICFMLANALTFGVLANTIDNFSQGYTDRNFMPSFDDFSLWDDVVHPFFLSIAVYISSFGLLIAIVFGTVWYAWNSFSSQIANPTQDTISTLDKQSAQSIDHVKKVTEKLKQQNAGRSGIEVGEDGLTDAQRANVQEEAEFQRLNDLTKNYKKAQLESTIGKTPETQEKEMKAMLTQFMQFAGIFLLLAGLALLWGLFYFPAACAVAGYTRSFVATINPLVGLDTIKHLGFDYVKILFMCFLMSIMSSVIGMILSIIFLPFALPRFGNLPAQFVGSFFSFYFAIAFAVTLGYALYKNSDKLKLYKG